MAARYAQAQRTALPIREDAETVLIASEAKAAFGEEARPLRVPDCPAQPEAPVRLPMIKPGFPSCMPAPADAKGRRRRSARTEPQGEDGTGLPRLCIGWNRRWQNIRMRIRGMSIRSAPSCRKREI